MIDGEASHRPPRSDLPVALIIDLCLHRTVSELCGGRILPYPIRQMIKDYALVFFTNETLRRAAQMWCNDRAAAKELYGEINDWAPPCLRCLATHDSTIVLIVGMCDVLEA